MKPCGPFRTDRSGKRLEASQKIFFSVNTDTDNIRRTEVVRLHGCVGPCPHPPEVPPMLTCDSMHSIILLMFVTVWALIGQFTFIK